MRIDSYIECPPLSLPPTSQARHVLDPSFALHYSLDLALCFALKQVSESHNPSPELWPRNTLCNTEKCFEERGRKRKWSPNNTALHEFYISLLKPIPLLSLVLYYSPQKPQLF
ncbi:hypothetical protein IAQ61_001058 [Plenodomus lingam]|uniref:uncharacterized protein n=1 Tax=Leptosphaeria maculans TaxID=5022 RepID=UPI00333159F7|nr:hypothetical protein IAQ61_001058 [Plenodomus lingam]